MTVKKSVVDLDQALVGAISRRTSHVAVVFPRVNLYVRGPEKSIVTPVVEAEIRVWDGVVEQCPRRLPRRLTRWELRCRSGVRSASLPISFGASGGVRLTIEFSRDDSLVVRGSRASVRVSRRVAQLAAGRRGKPRTARQGIARRRLPSGGSI